MTGIFIGADAGGGVLQWLDLARANRHGLIAGATGTGKTVTVQGIVEGFSAAGVASFVADVKGDLAGLGMPGSPAARTHSAFAARAAEIAMDGWAYAPAPVQFWDLFGTAGHPVRATVAEMGPVLLARLMDLNAVQAGVLAIAFHVADAEAMPLLDLDDLQAMLAACAARASELSATHGNVSRQSVGAIQRALLQLRSEGDDRLFGEPALDVRDMIATDDRGRGIVNILAADRLMSSPRLYATFLLWLLSELFETLPEVGDTDRPVLAFFFDEAHLLFTDAPRPLGEKVEQVVRLIRSKGVGVYFITQNPTDIPDAVAGQLGNRVQHRLNAFTPRDQRAVAAAADTFRPNPAVDVRRAITELKVGEALVSLLGSDGAPAPVERTLVRPPSSRVGPLTDEERRVLIRTDAVGDRYDTVVDRESAREMLAARTVAATEAADAARAGAEAGRRDHDAAAAAREAERGRRQAEREAARDPWKRAVDSATRSAGSAVGRTVANEVTKAVLGRGRSGGMAGRLLRGVLGGLFRR